jgi:hypothetical protein
VRLPRGAGLVRWLGPALLAAGCGGGDRGRPIPESSVAVVVGADGSYELHLPPRWLGRYQVDTLSTAERGTALPGTWVFLYQPADSAMRPQALLAVAVYDSAAWQAVRADGGPPPGDSVTAHARRVYVLGLPQSNPFPPGSVDAVRFDSLQLKPAELPTIVRPR